MHSTDPARFEHAKRAFATRRVPAAAMRTLVVDERRPRAGDLILARVTALGSHSRIELPTGRRALLRPGDEIILAYGNRYAPDQYEAYTPERLGPCHMAAAGGIAAVATAWHDRLKGPTEIEALGFVGDGLGRVLNLRDFALPERAGRLPRALAVFGTSMNAGKTTMAAGLVAGLSAAGLRVGAAKITGTAAGGDLWAMLDHGAIAAVDFTDAGFATTFGADVNAIVSGAARLLRHLVSNAGAEVVVVEIADGLFQEETRELAASPSFRALIDGTVFAAGDAMGAVAGATTLRDLGHRLVAIGGAMTRSPLAIRETRAGTEFDVLSLADISTPTVAAGLMRPLRTQSPVGPAALGLSLLVQSA